MDDQKISTAGSLESAERRAEQAPGRVENVKQAEETPRGLYSGQGKVAGKVKKGGKWKKWAPAVAVLGLILVVGMVVGTLQSLMPVAIAERIIEKFNSVGVSTTAESDAWLDTQLNQGIREEELTDSTDDEDAYALSEFQVNQFESQGMKVVEVDGCAVILYQDELTEEWTPVVGTACSATVGGLSANGEARDVNATTFTKNVATAAAVEKVRTPVSVAAALNDTNFRYPYTTAAKPWRGGNSGWYDSVMTDVSKTKMAIDRNRWVNYTAENTSTMTEDFKNTAASAVKEKMKDAELVVEKTFGDGSACSTVRTDWNLQDVGNTFVADKTWTVVSRVGDSKQLEGEVLAVKNVGTCDCVETDDDDDCIWWEQTITASDENASVNYAKDADSLGSALQHRAMEAATIAKIGADENGNIVNETCAKVDGIVSAYSVVQAYENVQYLNLVSGYLEAVDKMKAGDGTKSPINEYATILTTNVDTVTYDDVGNETVTENRNAMESQGMNWLFNDVEIDSNDPTIKNVNIGAALSSASFGDGDTTEVFKKCGYANLSSGNTNIDKTGMDFIPILGQSMDIVQQGIKLGVGKTVTSAINTFFATSMSTVAKRMMGVVVEDVATDWKGENFGNALISGAGKYLGGNATSGGQSPGSMAKVVAYLGEQQAVLAQEAEYQRAMRSPFDATSPYTFLGSLTYALLPMAYSSSGVMSILTQVSSVMSNALTALFPTASAVNINQEITSAGNCPLLDGVNIVGDAFCNAYIITDVSTLATSPVAIDTIVKRMGETTEIAANGTVRTISANFEDGKIKEDSNLARYITYCGQRSSQYNVKDSTIVEDLQDSIDAEGNWLQKIIRKIIKMVPLLNDTQDTLETINKHDKMQWATGEACMATDDNEYWGENEYYQRYMEKERWLENTNPGYTSPVTKLSKAYLEKTTANDDTLEGVIARFSGMTVDEVDDTMDLIAYYMFLDGYDASVLYAFGADPTKVEQLLQFDAGEVGGQIYNIWLAQTQYDDLRNRNFIIL